MPGTGSVTGPVHLAKNAAGENKTRAHKRNAQHNRNTTQRARTHHAHIHRQYKSTKANRHRQRQPITRTSHQQQQDAHMNAQSNRARVYAHAEQLAARAERRRIRSDRHSSTNTEARRHRRNTQYSKDRQQAFCHALFHTYARATTCSKL